MEVVRDKTKSNKIFSEFYENLHSFSPILDSLTEIRPVFAQCQGGRPPLTLGTGPATPPTRASPTAARSG